MDGGGITPLPSGSSEQIEKQRWSTTADTNVVVEDDRKRGTSTVNHDCVVPLTSGSSEEKIERQRWATSATTTPVSSPPINIAEEERPLIAELCDYFLRRGVLVDFCTAWGAARMCLVFLMMSPEPTPDVLQTTGADELIAVATANLDLSVDATACLLATLVASGATAALLAVDPHLLESRLAFSCDQGRNTEASNSSSTFNSNGSSSSSNTPAVRQPAQEEAAREITAAVAATALAEACRAWADTVEAVESTARKGEVNGTDEEEKNSTLRRSDASRADEEKGMAHPVPVAVGAESADENTERVRMEPHASACCVPSDSDIKFTKTAPAATGPSFFCGRNRPRAVRYKQRCIHMLTCYIFFYACLLFVGVLRSFEHSQ